jgi:hypothetical protein
VYGRGRAGDSPRSINPGPILARISFVATTSPDIRHTDQPRKPGVQKLLTLFAAGPGRSRRPLDLAATAAFAAGGVLLIWSAYIHFHLWDEADGYRTIATIGPLFLVQSIAGLVIGLGVVVVRRLWAAVIGIGFALTTIAGFLVTVAVGLFGFKDSWLAPFAKQAFIIEVVAVAVLIAAAALCLVGSVPRARTGTTPAGTAT